MAARGNRNYNLPADFHFAACCMPNRGMLLTAADNHVTGPDDMIGLAVENQRASHATGAT